MTACFFSSYAIYESSKRNLRNFLSWTAPALRIAGLMALNGFPSIVILTSESSKLSLGFISLKSLLLIVNVFKLYKVQTLSGKFYNLLL